MKKLICNLEHLVLLQNSDLELLTITLQILLRFSIVDSSVCGYLTQCLNYWQSTEGRLHSILEIADMCRCNSGLKLCTCHCVKFQLVLELLTIHSLETGQIGNCCQFICEDVTQVLNCWQFTGQIGNCWQFSIWRLFTVHYVKIQLRF